ncbi:germination protein, Ger(x)C family [Caldicellulosiruptor acetigenus I77R1B]|uniref:Germination protein, Ger(X)C family n=1 Tax=Caldicellulosiruptor acetigenus (strain ATCC 700853 / DSM 12137 / I77R1B) TaxID=632335 RepID=E4S3X5_CALA7|nr:Ger(x)C family spore germination protein [Caldicellulosiruptor acetigenus]ADQ40274.1 germination protein, Ger(x)C family [Caldicellulosiruptor acetigenus I77R1B]
MKPKRRAFLAILIVFLAFLLSGCWDRVEIEDRGYILALGVDKYDPSDLNKYETREYIDLDRKTQKFSPEQQKPDIKTDQKGIDPQTKRKVKPPLPSSKNEYKFAVTVLFPNLRTIGKDSKPDEQMRFLFVRPTNNVIGIRNYLEREINKRLYYGYLKVVVLGRDLVEEPGYVREVLDALNRESDIPQNTFLLVSETTARDILNTMPLVQPVTGIHLFEISKNASIYGRIIDTPLSQVVNSFINSNCAVISRVEPGVETLKVAGAAVFKNFRFVGWLDEKQLQIYKLLMGKAKHTFIDDLKYKSTHVPFITTEIQTKKKIKSEKGRLKIVYNLRIEGEVIEFVFKSGYKVLDDPMRKYIQSELNKIIKKRADDLIYLLKYRYNADVLGIGDFISKHRPKDWEKLKKNWDDEFKKIDIEVVTDVRLRRSGTIY